MGALQERFQSRGINPQYRVVQAVGASHAPTFSFQVILGDLTATGSGSSKKQAKVTTVTMLTVTDPNRLTPLQMLKVEFSYFLSFFVVTL